MNIIQIIDGFLGGKIPLEHFLCVWKSFFAGKPQENETRKNIESFLAHKWQQSSCQCLTADMSAIGCMPREFLEDFALIEKYLALGGILALNIDFLKPRMDQLFTFHSEYISSTEENWEAALMVEYFENFRLLGMLLSAEGEQRAAHVLQAYKLRRVPLAAAV